MYVHISQKYCNVVRDKYSSDSHLLCTIKQLFVVITAVVFFIVTDHACLDLRVNSRCSVLGGGGW